MKKYDPFKEEELSHIFSPIDLEDLFQKSPGATVVNNENFTSMSITEEFRKVIFSHNDEDLGFTPSCECGYLIGRFYIGSTCSKCSTKVSTDYVDELTHTTWLSSPMHGAPFIHPVWFYILSTWQICGKGTPHLLAMCLDPDKEVPPPLAHVITDKGFIYFHENADNIFKYLFEEFQWNAAGRRKMEWIKLFYEKYRHLLFTTKLPILHSSLHPIMKSGNSLKFADKTTKEILEAVFNLSTLSFVSRTLLIGKKTKDKTLWNIYSKIMKYYESIIKQKLSSKYALLH